MVHVRQFTVLYVDDEELLLELGRRFLERNGEFRVDVVLSAQEALRLCFFDTYDAIISDYQMPGMDGIVLLKEIRKQGNDIPFILFTGKGREEVVIEAINNGADFYVQKGGDPKSQFAELAHKIKQAVHKREVEKSLKDSKKQLSDVLNFLPDPTFAINNAGRVIAWNRAIEEMTGYSSSQMVGKGDYEYALPFYGHRRPILIDLIHESDERLSKYYTHISRSEDAISAEAEYVKIKGQRVFLYVKACPLYNSDGAITGAIESIRDITELKESAQKVEESRAKYKFLAEHSRDAIVIVAHDNTILYINATGVQLLEEDSIEAVLSQKNLMRYIHPDSADLFVYDSEQIKIGNEGYIAKYKLITAKEREIWVESQGLNIPYKDGRALFISLRDITQRKQIEEEREVYLQNALAQENFTRALLDALPIPVLWKDTQLRYLGCNEAYSRFFGVDKEYVTGKTAEEIWSDPRDAHAIREHDFELLKSRKIRPFQRKITDKNGKTHDIVVYKSIFSDHEGNVAGIVGAMQDMSEYKQMLGDLKKQEELFRMMVTQSSDVFIIISPDYDITYISPNYSCIAGFLSEEVIGPALRLIHPDDRATVLECFERLKQNVSFIETAEFRSMKRDGSYVLLEGVGVNCIDNPAIRGILITARDITARKRVEERLSVITRLFENISSSTPIYVALLDHEGYILFSNRSFRAGYEDAERVLPRMRIQDCFAPDWEEECSQVLRYTIEHGQSSVHECRIYADSKDTVISAAFFPICEGEKRFVGFIGLDVTEQKRLQYQFSESVSQRASLEEEVKKRTDEITELLSLKESLITAIAHDLRTPLTPLVALLPVLEYEDDYQKRGEIIRLLQKSANQIALIVQNLLQMNALKPGFLREDVSDINLKEAIHNVLPVHMILAEQKGVRIEPDIPEGVVIRSSLPHLISIIDNIIANAVKFSRSGGTVQIHVQDQGEVVHISVQDDGLGIPQQDLARVFEPFFKVDRSRHDRSSLGLGLSVTKRLVQVIGGTISIQSQGPATGTVVEITVPKVIDKMEGWGVFG